jgi:hypothetical protein
MCLRSILSLLWAHVRAKAEDWDELANAVKLEAEAAKRVADATITDALDKFAIAHLEAEAAKLVADAAIADALDKFAIAHRAKVRAAVAYEQRLF